MNLLPRIDLLAFLVADHVYCDQGSNKYVIAGTFHQLNVSAFPSVFHKTIGVFVKLANFSGSAAVTIVFEDQFTGDALMRTQSLMISSTDPECPIEFALEVPPLPLPRPGRYVFKLLVDGAVIGSSAIDVRSLSATERGR